MEAANQLDWSDDQIARFWDYWSTRDDAQESYFALQVGQGITHFASYVGSLARSACPGFRLGAWPLGVSSARLRSERLCNRYFAAVDR